MQAPRDTSEHGKRPMQPSDLHRVSRLGAPVLHGPHAWVTVTRSDLEANQSRTQLVRITIDSGRAVEWTSGEQSVTGFDIEANSGAVAFTRAPAAGAQPQLWTIPTTGGEPRRVTDLPRGAHDPKWITGSRTVLVRTEVAPQAPTFDGTRAYDEKHAKTDATEPHVTEDRVFRFWDRWLTREGVARFVEVDLDTGSIRDLLPDWDRWLDLMDPSDAFSVSPDGHYLAICGDVAGEGHPYVRFGLFLFDRRTGSLAPLLVDHDADRVMPVWAPSSEFVVFGELHEPASSAASHKIARYDVATGTRTVLVDDAHCAPRQWKVSSDNQSIWFLAERDGGVGLFRVSAAGGDVQCVASGGSAAAFDLDDSDSAVCMHTSLASFPELVSAVGGAFSPITSFNAELTGELELGTVEHRVFSGADGARVHLHLVRPANHGGRPLPLVHLLHGGPHGAWLDEFHLRWNAQVFAARGYAVALVNFHGSSSFGDAFTGSIEGAWGDKPYRDIEAATDSLIASGVARPDELYLAGGSYGGYLSAWIGTQTQRYRAAVAHAAVHDFRILFASDMTESITEFIMGAEPWSDRERALRYDPASSAAGLVTPTLVTHGARDYRVTLDQGLTLYGTLKARGVPAKLIVYPTENHWVLTPKNSIHWYEQVLEWLERHAPAEST